MSEEKTERWIPYEQAEERADLVRAIVRHGNDNLAISLSRGSKIKLHRANEAYVVLATWLVVSRVSNYAVPLDEAKVLADDFLRADLCFFTVVSTATTHREGQDLLEAARESARTDGACLLEAAERRKDVPAVLVDAVNVGLQELLQDVQ